MARRAYKERPKRQKRPKDKKMPKSARSFTGFLALVGGIAAACAAALLQARKATKLRGDRDKRLLQSVRGVPLVVTDHAAQRMDCRHISKAEVEELLRTGSINERKSDLGLLPCPKLVVDGATGSQKKNAQVVISACPQASHLVTVIDLDRDWANCYRD